jgi:hypothetical protein
MTVESRAIPKLAAWNVESPQKDNCWEQPIALLTDNRS